MRHGSGFHNVHRQAEFNPKINCIEGTKTMSKNARILVTGAGGFIGHHLVKRLRGEGNWVRGTLMMRCWRCAEGSSRCTTWQPTWAESASSPPNTRRLRATTS